MWCLRGNLSTAITSGNAITIATNNVTIDCNGFKIGGLAAGDDSTAKGIFAFSSHNTTVRRCIVRGFLHGINLSGAGHLIENNQLDNNLSVGVFVSGDNSRIQGNRIYDTGGASSGNSSFGIYASGDVIDNTVAGVFGTGTDFWSTGIFLFNGTGEVRGNQVRGLIAAGSGEARGIHAGSDGVRIAGNHVSAAVLTQGSGIIESGANVFCTGNTVVNFSITYNGCDHAFGNLPMP